ncbi:hypothetical protein B0H66DRAFT_634487 [Apodospora peruviana]|uniref:Heterokaryon incompatibility domain-containing protein n=1 Tax=Apodospora peruviana TaxID=516989 RepID=A0AAE0MEI7_9PEZI|nr:hypothetical protein B0H66DRAFT_634487 [Apodospora peruviana]
MRLLNVDTLEVDEFFGVDIPPYAIVSHTWGREEVTFSEIGAVSKHRRGLSKQSQQSKTDQNQLIARGMPRSGAIDRADITRMMLLSSMMVAMRTGTYPLSYQGLMSRSITDGRTGDLEKSRDQEKERGYMFPQQPPQPPPSHHDFERKAGFSKISSACRQAARDGFRYLWIDTCCIDKANGHELSEAINAMFSWYQGAAVCYVHLEDVQYQDYKQGYRTWEHDFIRSRWFTRGWTLQELVAPRRVVFYAKGWEWLGTKADLAQSIEKVTKIDEKVLRDPSQIEKTCLARRMTWASQRKTTRPEDVAYSLMGIFGVSMPLLYGEGGESAFIRLQEEIMRTSDDHTLFAWGLLKKENDTIPTHYDSLEEFDHDEMVGMTGILAKSPTDFAGMDRVVPAVTTMAEGDAAYKMTNKGLKIKLKLSPVSFGHVTNQKFYLGVLNCQHSEDDPSSRLGMLLTETETPNVLFRTRTKMYSWVSGKALATAVPRQIYICQNNPARLPRLGQSDELIWIKARDLVSPGYQIVDIQAKRSHWNKEFSTLRVTGIADKVFYQLAVITFFNKHTKQGFFVRVLVDAGSKSYFVDLSQPKTTTQSQPSSGDKKTADETVSWLKQEAGRIWDKPGQIRVIIDPNQPQPSAGTKTLRRMQMQDIANPDVYGADEQPSWKTKGIDDDWEVAEDQEFSSSVTFTEVWEKEYNRTVKAEVGRKKEVIVLEISSMLWEPAVTAERLGAEVPGDENKIETLMGPSVVGVEA